MVLKHKSILASAAIIASLAFATGANAADPELTSSNNSKVEITGGDLTLNASAVGNFGTHKLEAKVKDVFTNFDGNFIVNDARGSHEGWSLKVSASKFVEKMPETPVAGTVPFEFSSEFLSLAKPTLTNTTFAGATVASEVSNLMAEYTQLNSTGIKVSEAQIGYGAGQYTFDFGPKALKLVLDPSAIRIDTQNYPGTFTPYETTISWTLAAGPETTVTP